jgi:acid phosphatase (class A)
MRIVLLPLWSLCFLSLTSFGQTRGLTPARGVYKELSGLDGSSVDEAVDRLRFPFDQAKADRRLSLTPVYLDQSVWEKIQIADPPKNSSKRTRAELDYLIRLQQQRTPEDIRASLYMAKVYYNSRTQPTDSTYARYRRNLFHIGRSIGTWFNADNLPVTADLMANVWRDASYFIWKLKYRYARVRPITLDPAIKNLEVTDWEAYPSGHAANSYVNAFVFSELAPEFADIFVKDAFDMAHSREILGVHYPSDSEASRQLARQIVNQLLQSEKFRHDLERAKHEWLVKAHER